ncbi:protein PAT1 homolog 1 isoform X1 [Ischnura elegans]|uniref:protein PAT1 homolog 1 isoform X1 n=1 Tax=Ischnura elegans TaxID=197161 RepID=UPI001ED89B55|nr:protein PAT1 homolog 1 isoform X1 [Ischnura elegans]
MEEQLADSFFGFDATLSGSPDDLNDETEDGQDEEFYDALNEETFGTDAVEGDWEQDHEKLAEITESARVRSNSYNGAGDRYNENGADLDGVVGGDSDLADSISRMVLEDQEEMLSPNSKGSRNYALQMENFDGSYSSSAPSGFSLWSNGGFSKGPQHQTVMTVPAASGTIWDPAVLQTSSAPRKEAGNALSSLIPSVRTVKDLERHLLHGRDGGQREQSVPSPSVPSGGPIGQLPKPSAAWLLEDIERELTSSKSVSSQTTTTTPTSSASPASIHPLTSQSSSSSHVPPAAPPVVAPVGMGRTFSAHRPPPNLQRNLPHHIPPHQQHPPNIPPPPHPFLPGSLPPSMLPPQAPAPPMALVNMTAVRQMIQPPLAAIAQNQRLMGAGGPGNMLLFMSKDGGPQQRGDSSKGFLDAMRVSDRLGSRVPHPNHLHQGGVLPNFNHPLHQHPHPHRVGPDFGRPHGFPPGHNGQMSRFPHPPYPLPNQQMPHRGFFGRQGNALGNFPPQFHHHHPPPHLMHGQHNAHLHHLHHLNGSEEWDEYSGLMTQWEKQFLLNIQRMQLQSDRPYVDDYYYTMYARRKKEREMAAGGKGNGLSTQSKSLERDHNLRDKDNKRTEHHKYTPAQFENSLGKLQVVSVMAPRKIIDLDMTPPEKMETGSQLTARDSRRIKLEIERLYTFLLQIEDLKIPWIEKQDLTTTESKEELVTKILNSLHQEEKLSAILNFRKGKMLVVRLLPHLEPELQMQLWIYLFRNLPSVIRKDSADSCLPLFIPHFQKWASDTGPGALSQIVSTLVPNSSVAHSRSPSPLISSKNPLTVALGNKFGSSSVVTIAERIIELQSKDSLNEGRTMDAGGDRSELSSKQGLWSKFLDSLFDAAAAVPEAAATFKGSILSQHRLTSTPKGLGSSPSPTLPTVHEGESWTIPVERLAALSKVLHSLHDEAVPVKSSAKLVADS